MVTRSHSTENISIAFLYARIQSQTKEYFSIQERKFWPKNEKWSPSFQKLVMVSSHINKSPVRRRKKRKKRIFFIRGKIKDSYCLMISHTSGSGSRSKWSVIVAPGNLAPSTDSKFSEMLWAWWREIFLSRKTICASMNISSHDLRVLR